MMANSAYLFLPGDVEWICGEVKISYVLSAGLWFALITCRINGS